MTKFTPQLPVELCSTGSWNANQPQEILRLWKLFDLSGFLEAFFQISHHGFAIKDQGNQEAQGRDQHIHRHDQPEPGPVFDLAGKFAYGDGFEEIGGKQSQEIADGVIITGTPDVGGIFVADAEKFTAVAQGNEAQLRLEDLIEHNEEHEDQQTCGSTEDVLIGNLVHTQQHHQHGDGTNHPVMIVEPDDIQGFAQLIGLSQRLFGVEQGDQTADHADVEHIVLDFLVFDPEEDGKQRDIGTADVDEPAVPEHSGLVDGVGRDVDLQKMQRKADGEESEKPQLLGQRFSVAKTVIQSCSGTKAEGQPEKVPAVKHTDDHFCNLLY